ncbi:MAG: creatininase family protein [Devosia sp.]|uniref:creatininase family protein n=1 Tax=Devosia sp. TaxID=1871048 RepID=UPI001ACA441D|nr:creatininase family protein [Devosia sp.]MBN9315862.1 creatininase family protein [Devosia sp.]
MLDAAGASWEDVSAAIARGLVAVLPVGAVEQHGAHLPLLTDTVMATGVARRIAEGCDGLLLPALAYGDAWTTEGWAGTLSLSPETLRRSVEDIGRGLMRMGVRGLVTVNGHFGNREPISLAARALSEAGFPVLHLDYPRLEALAAELMDSKPAGPGFYHADEVETSMMLALAPETVRMDRARPEYPEFPELFGSEPMKLSAFNTSGVFGDPRPASAEKGEAMIAGIAAESLRLISLWRGKHGI